jgi:hypothetical protein
LRAARTTDHDGAQRELQAIVPGGTPARVVAHVNKITLFRFRPMATEGGHTLCPFPSADDPECDHLFDLFEPAKSGTGIEAFHLALARNQVRSFRCGIYGPGLNAGGTLHMAEVREDGVSYRCLGALGAGRRDPFFSRCF